MVTDLSTSYGNGRDENKNPNEKEETTLGVWNDPTEVGRS